jgi:Skp family chaperone for outer membrane proteins
MDLKVSKTTLVILVVALAFLFTASNIMYGKVNETVLIKIVEQQTLETNKLMKMVFAKQKELDNIKEELNSLKKISALTAGKPSAVKK